MSETETCRYQKECKKMGYDCNEKDNPNCYNFLAFYNGLWS